MSRPRVLLVTRNFPPLMGGMERLNWHMVNELAKTCDVRLIGPSGCAQYTPESVAVSELPLQPLWRFLLALQLKSIRQVHSWKPQWILAGSGLTALAAYGGAKFGKAKAVVYVHGLDVGVRHPLYRLIWRPVLRRMDRVIANSHATAELCRAINIPDKCIGIVPPGVSLPISKYDVESAADFKQRHSLGGFKVLLSVGRLTERKGLREFVEKALPQIVKACPETLLVIVGDAPKDSLFAKSQGPEAILSAARAYGVESNLRFVGSINDYQYLSMVYRLADCHVFPVRQIPGDPEGFGMVAVEAAAHGLPTVAFATGGVTDAVSDASSGALVEPGDYSSFSRATIKMLTDPDITEDSCRSFARQFVWEEFGRKISDQLPF